MKLNSRLNWLLIRANYYLDKDKFYNAYNTYIKCLAIDPNNIEALCNLGFLLCELGLDKQALKCLRRAFSIDCADDYVLLNLSSALIGIRNYNEAIEALNMIKNKNHSAYNNLGWAYYKLKRYYEAIYYFDISIELEKDNADAYTNRGLAKIELKEIKEAIEDCEKGNALGDIMAGLKLIELGKNHYHSCISN